jgi:predicted transcriptional regulator
MSTKVIECMEKIQKINIISPYEKTVNILNRFVENELDHLLVMDGEKLVGIVTRVDIMKLLKVKMDLGK